ncbi:SNF1-related protein kinase regulatory subunit gamma-1-like [Zingiber officinale]|uniref:CBS domain-containing protein n=1 Tax=Zingiber officinale TaxID=94328 RepID=A0A8J5M9Q9_ZINOF|nr:SNF1-related protein kinase regulatory subunit gamma-1-like [Zingiber officinale]KAG6537825.1 hypothetical protein ZIOFF_002924 [Zingiber officinale]
MKSSSGGVAAAGETEPLAPRSRRKDEQTVASSSSLQSFLNHIPISAIPSVHASVPVLEVRFDDCVEHAIRLMYENNVFGAPIVDTGDALSTRNPMDKDIGLIEFSSLLLWSLKEIDKVEIESKGSNHGFLDVLKQNSHIGQTKIAELAKSFLWEPFFPAYEVDTLFHALLLFSKHHRLNVIPVVDQSKCTVSGFISQHAVIELLLQSNGLEWFDKVAEKSLLEYGLIDSAGVVSIYSDQTLVDVLHILWDKQINGVPIVDRRSGLLIGSVKRSDIYLLVKDDSLFSKRKTLTIEEFSKIRKAAQDSNLSTKTELASVGLLRLENSNLPKTSNPVVLRKHDSLKKTMELMLVSLSEICFLVSDSGELEGMVTLKDILLPFSPPSMDSRIDGGGFFKSVLYQTGSYVDDGGMVRRT